MEAIEIRSEGEKRVLANPIPKEGSKIDVGKLTIDKNLFSYFSPDLMIKELIMPVNYKLTRGEGKSLAQQEWILTLAVAETNFKDLQSNSDWYAEQIRDAVPEFWPGKLILNVVPTAKEEIVGRYQQLKQLWDMRIIEAQQLAMPPAQEPVHVEPSFQDTIREAVSRLNRAIFEPTQTKIEVVGDAVPLKPEQVFDLRVNEKAFSRRILCQIFDVAILMGASDIHFEYRKYTEDVPYIQVRVRRDGLMEDLTELPGSVGPQILNVLGKAGGDAIDTENLHKYPQDGKCIMMTTDKRRFDGRIGFRPVTATGRSFNATVRLLDSSRAFEFSKIDLSEHNARVLKKAMALDHGLIILTGPTGSGKSSTIQACLRKMITPELKVVTIEDPVEYFLSGAEQLEVNDKIEGRDFASLLRAVLRGDPDIIFLGEIRDAETAKVAVEASMTGHLVFTTVHANTALEAVDRIAGLGVHRELVANAIAAVGAQRLVRRVLPERWQPGVKPIHEVESYCEEQLSEKDKSKGFKLLGLKPEYTAGDKGNYRGRLGVHSFVFFDDQLKQAFSSGKSAIELTEMARQKGMRSLMYDGLLKVNQGMTSLEEVALMLRGA